MADRRPEAYITGIGAVTPIGVGRKKLWSSLLANESGAGPITLFDPEDFDVRIAAECTDFDPESFMDRKVAARTDRFAQMGFASAKLALEDAEGWDVLDNNPERVGLILGSGIGGVTSMETTQATIDSKGPSRVNPFAVTKIMPNSAAAHIGIQLGIQGPSITGALACTCGTDMMGLGYDLIRRGDADLVLCGASEAGLAPVIVAGFIAMRAMSRRNEEPEGACRPYDVHHSGFLIGEASAVIVLESAESVERRGSEPYAKITGVGRTTDAYNLTDPDPKGYGIMRAMQLAVAEAGLEGEQIGYINPHGTGTVAGDGPESQAMAEINPNVKVSATKSTLGHSLGASGAVETAICALAIKERMIPPMRNLTKVAEGCADLDYVVDVPREAPALEAALCANLGAGDHLPGMRMPSVSLRSTAGDPVDLSTLTGTTVVFCYPLTGRPDQDLPPGWDDIPGARGCTPQSCAFRDHHAELQELGARVFGLSAQDSAYQREAAERLHLPFLLLSDENLEFARALELPTFEAEGMTLVKRLTLVVEGGEILKVFYPVFPPGRNAEDVLSWLSERSAT